MARKRKQGGQTNDAAMPVMRPDAAGIDIGATEIFVAVGGDPTAENVRSFPTFTQDLYLLADWLKACRIETVAMESTGVYWIPFFDKWFVTDARFGQLNPAQNNQPRIWVGVIKLYF